MMLFHAVHVAPNLRFYMVCLLNFAAILSVAAAEDDVVSNNNMEDNTSKSDLLRTSATVTRTNMALFEERGDENIFQRESPALCCSDNSTAFANKNVQRKAEFLYSSGGDERYIPGDLTVHADGGNLLLSTGLRARVLAKSGKKVIYKDGTSTSKRSFHYSPKGGACFSQAEETSEGGWVYVSNSDPWDKAGGVSAITFDENGEVVNYNSRILRGTSGNSGGGKTPWGSWISCDSRSGQVYQTDPHGRRRGRLTALGGKETAKTNVQSFAYYDPDPSLIVPSFFITNGGVNANRRTNNNNNINAGEVRRFTPDKIAMKKRNREKDLRKWGALNSGTMDYLVLSGTNNTFWWTSDVVEGRNNAAIHFPHPGSVDVRGDHLYFISSSKKMLFVLNLTTNTYESSRTDAGVFDSQPGQIMQLLGRNSTNGNHMLYFCEDGVADVGLHGRKGNGDFFTILDHDWEELEADGLALSPNRKHMYVAFSDAGILYEITRDDGLPFEGSVLDIKYYR